MIFGYAKIHATNLTEDMPSVDPPRYNNVAGLAKKEVDSSRSARISQLINKALILSLLCSRLILNNKLVGHNITMVHHD